MKILKIRENKAVIEVESKELDNIVNSIMDQQYINGYEEGFNDWKKAYYADLDDDDPEKE